MQSVLNQTKDKIEDGYDAIMDSTSATLILMRITKLVNDFIKYILEDVL
jgi:hypothetical protein